MVCRVKADAGAKDAGFLIFVTLTTTLTLEDTATGRVIFKLGLEYKQTREADVGAIIVQIGLFGKIVDGNVIIKTLDASNADFCFIVNVYVAMSKFLEDDLVTVFSWNESAVFICTLIDARMFAI